MKWSNEILMCVVILMKYIINDNMIMCNINENINEIIIMCNINVILILILILMKCVCV